MNRRNFINAALASAAIAHPAHFELDELTIAEMQSRMQRKQLSSAALTHLYLNRIEQTNHRGPALRAVIEVNPDALRVARELDNERAKKGPRSPLHGIPILIKDNIDTGDRMQTTAGSLALVGAPTPPDAFVARKLREAGCVFLGKTNLSEWANFRGEHSTSGWSARGGQTRNPYALDRNPCGSSSGSGVAVSANLCAAGVGTETDGSIVCPSAMNGIVGIKPTVGLISRSGIIPISKSQDTAGPMTRTVRDAALLLGVMAGSDSRDDATKASAGKTYSDYTQFLRPDGLRGMRLGLTRQYVSRGRSLESVLKEVLQALREGGAEVVDPVEITADEKVGDAELTVMLYEFKAGLNSYLGGRGGRVQSLADCIAFNDAHHNEELVYFGQELMIQSQSKGALDDKAYKTALANCRKAMRHDGIDATLAKNKLDAIISLTTGPAHLTDLVSGDHIDADSSSPAAIAGYPHITVPAGDIFGLPVGLSFFGSAWSEPVLLKAAYAFEQVSKARRKPSFLPTVKL